MNHTHTKMVKNIHTNVCECARVCVCIYIYIYIYIYILLYGLLYFTLDPYLIMLSAKQVGMNIYVYVCIYIYICVYMYAQRNISN